ncbi:MAG TPA: hypothetical protein VM915_08735 [Verrucomicrobiae bacterium]|nr:hypothetical protein [Verrucomicrobiae bacterium]
MDELERAQIRLLLEHLGSEYHRESGEAHKAMHAQHAAKGCLQSGATVKAAIRICEEQSNLFIDKAVDGVAAVAQDTDAFAMIVTTLSAQFRGREEELRQAIRLATGGQVNKFGSVQREGERLFAEMQSRVFKRLEIHRFSFTRPSKGTLGSILSATKSDDQPVTAVEKRKNAGGAPLAAHWDEMWADIAVQLWNGDLQPKRQKDISDAMFDWLSSRDLDAGNTAVTARARALWVKVEAKLRG